jgi:hypothetical protein
VTRVALRLVAVAAVFALIAVVIVRRGMAEVHGTVSARTTPAGTFTFVVDDCASGHAFIPGFFGADLRGQQRFDLRLVGSGDDAQLWLFPPGAKRGAVSFGKAACTRWDVDNAWTNLTVNRVHTVSGHVHVSCDGPTGGLTADVDFVRCAR